MASKWKPQTISERASFQAPPPSITKLTFFLHLGASSLASLRLTASLSRSKTATISSMRAGGSGTFHSTSPLLSSSSSALSSNASNQASWAAVRALGSGR
jgi:hypothetical protein